MTACLIHIRLLRRAVATERAATKGHPFGAFLLATGDDMVVAEQSNINTVSHAQTSLARPCREVPVTVKSRIEGSGKVPEALVDLRVPYRTSTVKR